MKSPLSSKKLALAFILAPVSVGTFAVENQLEVSALYKRSNTNVTFEFDDISAGFNGDSGVGIGIAGRLSLSDRVYTFAEYQAYHTDLDVFLSSGNENLAAIQTTHTHTADLGLGYVLPISSHSTIEAELSAQLRATDLDSFILDLSSADGTVQYDGSDLKKTGLAWRLRWVSKVNEHLNLSLSIAGNDSGKLSILNNGVVLEDDTAFGVGVDYAVSENWKVGLSWESADEDTSALSVSRRF